MIASYIAFERLVPSALHRNRLIEECGEVHAAIDRVVSEKKNRTSIESASSFAAQEVEESARRGIRIVSIDDPDYPPLLKEIPDRPTHLYVRGLLDLGTLDACAAVVGARRPSPYSLRGAELIAGGLAEAGIVVASGLAYGIDAAAHRACIAKRSATLAVLGSGLLDIYPATNRPLAEEIVEKGGSIVSEYPLRTKPAKQRFPERNRIVAGIARGVCVIEAGNRSGALITARLATEYNRQVWIYPQPVGPDAPSGSFELLRAGASPVSEASHILADIAPTLAENSASIAAKKKFSDDSVKDAVLDCLRGGEAFSIEEIVSRSGLAREFVLKRVLQLEIAGRAAAMPGGLFRIRS